MTAPMPSCPRCTLNDRVITLPPPVPRPGHPMYAAESVWPYECTRCVLPFSGTDAEFVRMYPERERYRDAHKPRTRPGGGS